MMTFAGRLRRNSSVVVVLSVVALFLYWAYALALHHTSVLSGWSLLAACLILASYNLRKKMPFLPLGASAKWLQFHLYVGYFTLVLFLIHINFRFPTGWFEGTLAALYLGVAGTGVIGIFLSRRIAPLLVKPDREVLYERIPSHCHRIRERVEELVLQSVSETDSKTIADFYARRLRHYFEKPAFVMPNFLQPKSPRKAVLSDLRALERYLNDAERKILGEITELFALKDDLDFEYTYQSVVKYWLFLHIPLTYMLLVFAALHMVVVLSFLGDVR